MDELKAKEYAEERFKVLGSLEAQWNYIHSTGIILAINDLVKGNKINKSKLSALAWVHDLGKIEGNESHAEKSINFLKKDFKLDLVDIDCIKNHGSLGNPSTEEGKLFRYCDGLSIFYPEVLLFRFYAEATEGKSYAQIKEDLDKMYKKYLQAYSDNPEVIALLKKKYSLVFG